MAQVSRYQEVWNRLKQQGIVEIAAPARHHSRLRKAIIKRKDNDLGYKLQIAENNKRAFLRFKFEQDKVTVTLTIVIRSTWL